MQYLKQSTEVLALVGPFVDKTDGLTPELGITLGAADEAELITHGATGGTDISGNTWATATAVEGWYNLTCTPTDTSVLGMLAVVVQDDSVCLPVHVRFMVLPANIWDSWFSTDKQQVDTTQVAGNTTAGTNLKAMYDGTGYAGGAIRIGSDIQEIDGASTGIVNLQNMYDGTGYAGGAIRFQADVQELNGASAGAVNLQAMYDGTGYAGGAIRTGADVQEIDGASAGAVNMQNFYDGTGYVGGSTKLSVSVPSATTISLAANTIPSATTVTLAAVQGSYAPAKAGNEMAVSSGTLVVVPSANTVSLAANQQIASATTVTIASAMTVSLAANQQIASATTVTIASAMTVSLAANQQIASATTVTIASAMTVSLAAGQQIASATTISFASGATCSVLSDIRNKVATGIEKNQPFPNLEFLMVDSADHRTGKTGQTVTATKSMDAASFVAASGSTAEIGNGIYQFDAATSDTNGTVITYKFTAASADDTFVTIKTSD